MGKLIEELTPGLMSFIEAQKVFFVGTAMSSGKINISPKGLDSLRILSPKQILWLNLTGSGNETAAHLLENDRMTIMFCAFDGKPLILRLYGSAKVYHQRDMEWEEYVSHFPKYIGSRQLVDMKIEMVQTSCGTGVPLMDFQSDRELLLKWGEKKGESGVIDYWKEKNTQSLDGHSTGILE